MIQFCQNEFWQLIDQTRSTWWDSSPPEFWTGRQSQRELFIANICSFITPRPFVLYKQQGGTTTFCELSLILHCCCLLSKVRFSSNYAYNWFSVILAFKLRPIFFITKTVAKWSRFSSRLRCCKKLMKPDFASDLISDFIKTFWFQ